MPNTPPRLLLPLNRSLVLALLATAVGLAASGVAVAQETVPEPTPALEEATTDAVVRSTARLRARIEERWRVVPLRDGLLLVPRQAGRSVKGVELGRDSLALDGRPVSVAELEDALGRDADPVLGLAALDHEARLALFEAAPTRRVSRAERIREAVRTQVDELEGREWRWRHHARVRIGSDLEIGPDERVGDAVVAVLGSVRVLGRVDGEVVAVGGDVHFGPTAVVYGDVTTVGGRVTMDEGARLFGSANEITVDLSSAWARLPAVAAPNFRLHVDEARVAAWSLGAALWRIGLLVVLAMAAAIVARRRVGVVRGAVGEAPFQAFVLGIGAHIVFLPALVLLAGALLVSVLGIPLLALMPLVVLAAALYGVVGLAAVLEGLGARVLGAAGARGELPVASVFVGAVLVFALTVVARVAWWMGWVSWPGALVLGAAGLGIELMAWTLGVGGLIAAALTRRSESQPMVVTPPPVPQM